MKQALLLIDIQNDYFPAGSMPLVGSAEAALRAGELLARFRKRQFPIVHIQHISARKGATFFLPGTDGAAIHEEVRPLPGETVITKHFPNSFRETRLLSLLSDLQVSRLVVCGMMTHMCVDATVRAAFDYGFSCTVIADACATRSLDFNGAEVSAFHVHAAFLAALGAVYAKVTDTREFLSALDETNFTP
jgi:nicotinamidase-related amidase